jgi:GGDEF domain-containing protein
MQAVEGCDQSQQAPLQRLKKNLKKSKNAGCQYALSLSVGVARFDPNNAVTLGELMTQADKAMYERKRKQPAACKSTAMKN